MGDNAGNLKTMYEAGFTAVKAWIDSRYRIFQFCAVLTVGSLTLGFDKQLLLSPPDPIPGIFLCILNFFVAAIGLRTELSNRIYNVPYFNLMNEIEAILNKDSDGKDILKEGGPFTRGREAMKSSFVGKMPNLDRFHMGFYILLMVTWIVLLFRL
jgi:hypothetical protein